jgi:Arc/MetJ family transcription regulator
MPDIAVSSDIERDIDEELLDEASRGLGTSSRNATLNGVLRYYVGESGPSDRKPARISNGWRMGASSVSRTSTRNCSKKRNDT